MRRFLFPLFLLLAGCGRGEPKVIYIERPAPTPAAPPAALPATWAVAPPKPEPTADERYAFALADAARFLADQRFDDALKSLETARRERDTDEVRDAIAATRGRLDRLNAARKTADDIQFVLQSKPDEAARLAAAALDQYGDTAAAATLTRLKKQADALVALSLDEPARRDRFRQEAEQQLTASNFRGAAVALEQALAFGPDPALQTRLDDVRQRLSRYDELRSRAAQLRRDAARLDEALAALQQAAQVWDTAEVRQEIDACTLAMKHRRDRVAVLPLELRADVGRPGFGRTVADELLPGLKARFDVVERAQIDRVIDELKLRAGDLMRDDANRRQFAQAFGVRYLVVGSVDWLGGVAIHARLIDAANGVVVQTGKVVGRSPDEAASLVPALAAMLQMSDDQRFAYETQLAQQSAPVAVVGAAPVPADQPIVTFTPRPAEVGGLVPQDFEQLPVAPAGPPPAAAVNVVIAPDARARPKLLGLSLELGDDLFRRGRFTDAARQFAIALSLNPQQADVQARLDRCRPHLPPVPPPVRVPRLAVLDFVPVGDANRVPPRLGAWSADQLGPYLQPPYDVLDRGEVGWYLARLGLTLRDVVIDPNARACLARALDCRLMVSGTLRPGPGGIEVAAHLIDAERGTRLSSAAIVVSGVAELRWRLGELARILLDPAERLRYQQQFDETAAIVRRAEECGRRNDFAGAISLYQAALALRPSDGRVMALLQQTQRQADLARLEAERQASLRRERELIEQHRQQQQELARRAEQARRDAERVAQMKAEADRLRERDAAFQHLLTQARQADARQDWSKAVTFLESALELKRDDAVARELTNLKAKIEAQARQKMEAERLAREREMRERREAEIARIRKEAEQRQREDGNFQRLFANAQANFKDNQFAAAIQALEAALQIKPNEPSATNLLKQARERMSADAGRMKREQEIESQYQRLMANGLANFKAKQYPAARQAAEEALALKPNDKAATVLLRDIDDAKAAASAEQMKRDRERESQFQRLLANGTASLRSKQFAAAIASLEEALKLKPNEPQALAALKSAKAGMSDDAEAARKQQEIDKQFQRLMANAAGNMKAKQYAAAIPPLEEALKLKPNHPVATLTLKEARDGLNAGNMKREQETESAFRRLIANAKSNIQAKQYAAAVPPLEEALKLRPNDAEATSLLKQARDGQSKAAKADGDFQKLLANGRANLQAKQYAAAIAALEEALELKPDDATAKNLLAAAKDGKAKAARPMPAPAPKAESPKPDNADRSAYNQAMGRGKALLSAKRYDDAIKQFDEALKRVPNDPEAARLKKQAEDAKKKP